ncbi:MAG: branched-chain amino acid ABC transporter permease [Actinomycetota bacterium]
MTKFVELLVSGVSLGFIYALIALGFVIVFQAMEVVNFAHGSILLLGGYLVARLHDPLGFALAVLVGIAVSAVTALAVERVLLRTTRGATPDSLSILTIGVDIIILTDLTRRIGANVLGLGDPWRDKLIRLAGFSVPQTRVAAIVVALVLIALLFAATKFTNWGISTRAYAEDREAAALMGIKQWRVSAIAWTIAGALAAVASIFLTAFPTPGLDNNTGLDALKAFPAAILGGLDSTTGALVGGITVGLAETFTSGYENDVLFLGRGFGSTMPYVIMILVLLWRPSGLFGTRTVARV